MSKKMFSFVGLLMAVVLGLVSCTPAATTTPAPATVPPATVPPATVPTNTVVTPTVDPMVQLVDAAKAEGTIVSYGLPDSWVNYGGLFQGFTAMYGITHQDTCLL